MRKYFLLVIIGFGLFMPLMVNMVVQIVFDPKFTFGNYFSETPDLALLGFFNAIPFIVLAFLVTSIKNTQNVKNIESAFKHKVGVVVTGLFTTIITFIINVDIWVGITLHRPGSSTSSITYFLLPLLMGIIIPIEYSVGRLLGKFILWLRKHKTIP
jgi:hypothetical protein